MKIVIIGAGSMAFAPALLGGFSRDGRYAGAEFALVDVSEKALAIIERVARRLSDERDLGWRVTASTNRRDVLPGADVVTTSIGVGGLGANRPDVEIPAKYGLVQAVGDTTGPGGLLRALRHVPVLVGIADDMEQLCPAATLYNFTNPLTVLTQAVNDLTGVRCVGLCIGVDLTWRHLCRVLGVEKKSTSILAGGLNHCHWILDFRLEGRPAFPILDAALNEMDGDPAAMARLRRQYTALANRPQEPFTGREPICTALYRRLGCYPGPGDAHVSEFFPQFIATTPGVPPAAEFGGGYLRHVRESYPVMWQRLVDMTDPANPLDEEVFGRELAWEHTQLLDLLAAVQDDTGEVFYVNLPNDGYIQNLPPGTVVEIPVRADAGGLHPYALGALPSSVTPPLAAKAEAYGLIIEAALEGSRRKAVQAFLSDPYCTDIGGAERMINEMIDAELPWLEAFR